MHICKFPLCFTKAEQTTKSTLQETFLNDTKTRNRLLYNILTTYAAIQVKFYSTLLPESDTVLYMVMLTCRNDKLLIDLARKHSFPRGFPIYWIPHEVFYPMGFRPKFDNDVSSQNELTVQLSNISKIEFFVKWSGFLGQLCVVEYNNNVYWTATTKNSADAEHPKVQDAIRIWSTYINDEILMYMHTNRIHICAEMLSFQDQVHGARVLKEGAMVTSIGRSSESPDSFVHYSSLPDTVAICKELGLDCGTAYVFVNQEEATQDATQILVKMNTYRDTMRCEMFDTLISTVDSSSCVFGSAPHSEFLGDVLEGFVLHIYHTDHTSTTVKWKLPHYTHRTMLLRTLLQKQHTLCGNVSKDAFEIFVNRWCVSTEGKQYWMKYLMVCALEWKTFSHKKLSNKCSPLIGDHITLSDHVFQCLESGHYAAHNIPQDFDKLVPKSITCVVAMCLIGIGAGKSSILKIVGEKLKDMYNEDSVYFVYGDRDTKIIKKDYHDAVKKGYRFIVLDKNIPDVRGVEWIDNAPVPVQKLLFVPDTQCDEATLIRTCQKVYTRQPPTDRKTFNKSVDNRMTTQKIDGIMNMFQRMINGDWNMLHERYTVHDLTGFYNYNDTHDEDIAHNIQHIITQKC